MWTEEMTVAGWSEDPSWHSPGSGESRDGNQRPDDWILWGCLAVREAWSMFPVFLPDQSTGWSPSQVGWTPWNVSGLRLGSVDGCSQRFSSAVPDNTEINRKNRVGSRITWNLMTIGLLISSPSLELILIWRVSIPTSRTTHYFHFRCVGVITRYKANL